MGVPHVEGVDIEFLSKKLHMMLPHLNERQRRLYLASEAKALGEGGLELVSEIAQCSLPTLYRGLQELEEGVVLGSRARAKGGGRKKNRG